MCVDGARDGYMIYKRACAWVMGDGRGDGYVYNISAN